MIKVIKRHARVMAIYPNTRGFGYAVFEGPEVLVDWGTKAARRERRDYGQRKMKQLITFFCPDVLVLPDCSSRLSQRSAGATRLIDRARKVATVREISVRFYSRYEIRNYFAAHGARNKDEIARVIARALPDLKPRVPPVRRLWMSEDCRMGLFDAIALVFTYYESEGMHAWETGMM